MKFYRRKNVENSLQSEPLQRFVWLYENSIDKFSGGFRGGAHPAHAEFEPPPP